MPPVVGRTFEMSLDEAAAEEPHDSLAAAHYAVTNPLPTGPQGTFNGNYSNTKQAARADSPVTPKRPYAVTNPLPTGPQDTFNGNYSNSPARRPKKHKRNEKLESRIEAKQAYVQELWKRHKTWKDIGGYEDTVEATLDKIKKFEIEIDQVYEEIFEVEEEANQCVVS
jgi:hypothetical protein